MMVMIIASILVPVDVTPINTLYVFVDIGIDTQHFVDTIKKNFEAGKRLVLVGTIQFVASIQVCVFERYNIKRQGNANRYYRL